MAQLDDDVAALGAADSAQQAAWLQGLADITAEVNALKGQIPNATVLAALEGTIQDVQARTTAITAADPGPQGVVIPPPPPPPTTGP